MSIKEQVLKRGNLSPLPQLKEEIKNLETHRKRLIKMDGYGKGSIAILNKINLLKAEIKGIEETKEQYKEEIGSILTRLLMWSQITFDNKSIIFENKIKEFDEICKDLKQLKKRLK